MEKKFSKFELARLKRTAQNVDQYLKQEAKLKSKIEALSKELEQISKLIELTDAPTVAMTGYNTKDIIKKVVTPTDKLDKNGNVIKQTTYEFIYPDTIVPPVVNDKAAEETIDNFESVDSTIYESDPETIRDENTNTIND